MASLETTRGRQVPAWQQANRYYQEPTNYVAEMQPYSQSASTAPATRKRRKTSGEYTIQKGDTLSAIAKRYGTTVQAIAKANGIADVNKIYVGDSLNIPGNTNARTTNTSAQNRNTQSNATNTTQSKTLPEVNIRDTNNNIYRSNSSLPEVNITSNKMNSNDAIAARYQRQINSQRSRDEYYRNQRIAQGRQAEQRVAARPNYEGLRTFATTAAALPGAYLFGTAASAAAPYIAEGANPRTWIEAGNRVTETVNRVGTRIARNRVARNNVRGIKESNKAAQQLERPINNRRTMREVRRIQKGLRSPQYPGYRSTSQPSLTTTKPRPTAQYQTQSGPQLGNYYRRSPNEAQQRFLNQVNTPKQTPKPTSKPKRAPRSKQGSKKNSK